MRRATCTTRATHEIRLKINQTALENHIGDATRDVHDAHDARKSPEMCLKIVQQALENHIGDAMRDAHDVHDARNA